jgi:hypothetical protein
MDVMRVRRRPGHSCVAHGAGLHAAKRMIISAARLLASLVRNPRDFRLIYVNPIMHDYLIHRGFRVVRKVRHSALYTMAT